jgi:LuxR family quorum sensing-dependent transcriptional regulator
MSIEAFDFIEGLDHKSTTDDVMDVTQRAVSGFGFETFIITALPEQRFDGAVLATRWPAEFLKLYTREQYHRFSPVARRCRQSANPFEWQTADFEDDPQPRATEVMRRAADFRLVSGFVVPIHGPNGFVACVAMAGVSVDLTARAKLALHLMAHYLFERVRSIVAADGRKRPVLTSREKEVLAWVASGKSAWEIGEILSIAKRTVDEHAQTAFRKLGAVNRTHAVAIAMREHIIEV